MLKNPPTNVGDMGSIPGCNDPLGQGMATHSSILVWETLWTEEADGLQSMGSQKVRHNLMTNTLRQLEAVDQIYNSVCDQ